MIRHHDGGGDHDRDYVRDCVRDYDRHARGYDGHARGHDDGGFQQVLLGSHLLLAANG